MRTRILSRWSVPPFPIAISLLLLTAMNGCSKTPETVFKSPLAGSWYPAEPEALKRQIDGFSKNAGHIKPSQEVFALILPHAGYRYSGQTAVLGLKKLGRAFHRVVVIGPSHRFPMKEKLSVPAATHYQTPLGKVALDVDFMDQLLTQPMFHREQRAHSQEHSVQIEVPLLQHLLDNNFKLVPLVAGDCSPATIQKTAAFLRTLMDDKTLVIASTDFTHFGPNFGYQPFRENIPGQIKSLDFGAYDFIRKLDRQGFQAYQAKTGATICGRIPIAIMLDLVPPSSTVELVDQTTSGALTGDYSNSVSYLAVAIYGSWKPVLAGVEEKKDGGLSQGDKQALLDLAKKSILFYLSKGNMPRPEEVGVSLSAAVKENRAAFVTLKKEGRLRGCIGDILPRAPLYQSVINNAVNAAVNDSRFPRVTGKEFENITLGISALTVPYEVDSHEKIRIGVDGIILSKQGRRAVFLPQVAPEQGWDVAETLTHLSMKAGLPRDAWKKGAKFEVFQAEVFGKE